MLRTLMQHKVMVLVIALVAAGALWFGLSQSSAPATTIVTSNPDGTTNAAGVTSSQDPIDQDTQRILDILLALRTVKLDDTIFSNSAFISLRDFSTEIILEPVGRPDPFAPLVGGASVSNAPFSNTAAPQTKKVLR